MFIYVVQINIVIKYCYVYLPNSCALVSSQLNVEKYSDTDNCLIATVYDDDDTVGTTYLYHLYHDTPTYQN